ncbi:VWA domain-containing protein [Mycolicibacterium mucogenicum]|uniref:VWA domain-containing protein n=1 Tax=Mycolicibacterium mucogenicum DSM 44124 TaxID=1226753 RepID=A0A8E4R353_MYCMU|nr:VWA domain-containing protein [Mycolicibacterium mucogenicum]QPG66954.1 VWA domain-containing protein [Mycolicibacterium mucogenicum DSM 44124]
MELTWPIAAIIGCVALAACVAFAVLWPHRHRRGDVRPLANTGRLRRLPEYRRAQRRNTISVWSAVALLAVSFGAALVSTARPTGLPTLDRRSEAAAPQDIMVCVGAPVSDAPVTATLQYFADAARGFSTERIGLTSANRRVVPLTRDYQYVAAEFTAYGRQIKRSDARPFVAPVRYTGYTPNIGDLLALCMTGFPPAAKDSATRRSLIYVGPEASSGGAGRLFDGAALRDLATSSKIQVNALIIGDDAGTVSELVHDTGGRSHPATDIGASLRDITRHPPPANRTNVAAKPVETPDAALLVALLAAGGAAWWRRRSTEHAGWRTWRWAGFGMAALLLIAAATRPTIGATAPPPQTAGALEPNVFLVLDRSSNMAAPGPDGRSRAAEASADIAQLVDRYPTARFAVLGFASGPALEWPLSADAWSLKPVVTTPVTYQTPELSHVDAGAASTVLRYQLLSAVQQYPDAKNLVYYLGAGTSESATPQREFDLPEGVVAGGAVIGYGDDAAPTLRTVAQQIGVPYVQRGEAGLPDTALTDVARPVPQAAGSAYSGTELYWVLSGLAAALLLIELFMTLREAARTRLDRVRL